MVTTVTKLTDRLELISFLWNSLLELLKLYMTCLAEYIPKSLLIHHVKIYHCL